MSESFVDLSYRGLALGKRIKLTRIRPATGFLELAAPLPVGTTIGIASDEGVLLEATVTEVCEQITGADRPPGMVVKPNLTIDAVERWWRSRVDAPGAADTQRKEPPHKEPPPADADGKVTLTSRRADAGVPELVDDGHNTAVMEVPADPPDTVIAEIPDDPRMPRDSTPPNLVDDGKRTIAMDAVDLVALGLSSSDQLPAVKPEDYADDANSGPIATGDKPDGKGKKKRKRR